MNGWIKCDIYIQWNYYSALKRKDILIQAIAWMSLEDIILSKTNQSQSTNMGQFLSYQVPRVVKLLVTESRKVAAKWDGKLLFNDYTISVGEGEQVPEKDNGDGCPVM